MFDPNSNEDPNLLHQQQRQYITTQQPPSNNTQSLNPQIQSLTLKSNSYSPEPPHLLISSQSMNTSTNNLTLNSNNSSGLIVPQHQNNTTSVVNLTIPRPRYGLTFTNP